jgi:imidazolonepropionase-like amidohydrolase
MKKLIRGNVLRIAMFLLVIPSILNAQFQQQQQPEEKELPSVSRTYAITNASITQAPGRKLQRGTVIIKNGLIVSVGANLSVPPDAIIIKGDSLHVYAGFIDGLSRTGVAKPKEDPAQNRERPRDPGNPQPELAGITPQNDVRSTLNATEKSIEELRAVGFTTSQVVPYGGMMPGAASLVLLKGKTVDEMTLVGKSAMYSELTAAQRVYPNTVIGVMAKWREIYRQAMLSKNYESMYASNRTGLNRPTSDRILEAWYPVIDRRLPVVFKADRYLESQRILALQSEFGFPLMIADLKEGWDAIPKLKSTNTKVFLSLDLPEDKKFESKNGKKEGEKKEGEKKEEVKKDEKPSKPDPEKQGLEKRKEEAIQQYTSQAASFQKAGIQFGFSALTVKPTDIQKNLRRMIAAGLTEDQALAALTTAPAQLLGVSDRLGSVDNGKIANLVLSDKPYFNEKAKVRYVFVEGVMFKYDPKDTPKPESTTGQNIVGTWTVTTETNDGKTEDKVTFKRDGNTFSGSITGTRFQQAANLEAIELTGNKLKYSYTTQAEGQSVKVDVEVTIEADTFKGTATAGRFGPFTVEGKKDPNK